MINNNWGVRSYWVYPSLTEWIWMVNMGYTPIKHSFGAYKTWGETRKMLCWNTRFFLRGGDAWIQHQVGKQLKQLVHLQIKKPDLDRPRPLTPKAAVASKSLRHLRCVYCCWKINARFVSSILHSADEHLQYFNCLHETHSLGLAKLSPHHAQPIIISSNLDGQLVLANRKKRLSRAWWVQFLETWHPASNIHTAEQTRTFTKKKRVNIKQKSHYEFSGPWYWFHVKYLFDKAHGFQVFQIDDGWS